MKLSNGFWQTYKEIPNEAEIPSHQLMLRAGLLHKTSAGIFTYLPMGLRSIKKVETIVREELDRINCFELFMSVITPGELWKETGRWEVFGPQMLKMKDRAERDLCMSPTNEESVTDVFRKTVKSYKQLPLTLYQINTKFRDEIRPRFGVMRGREFSMMDAYSFHADKKCLDEVYDQIFKAYENMFRRMGLSFIAVEADPGAMAEGGVKTHEFQVLANSGEDQVIKCSSPTCGYAANIEKGETVRKANPDTSGKTLLEEVETPQKGTIEGVCRFLNTAQEHSLKSLVYKGVFKDSDQEKFYLILLLGDDYLNEVKLKAVTKAQHLLPATDRDMENAGLLKGFIGPYQFPPQFQIFYDKAIDLKAPYVVGANKSDKHLKGFVPARDTETGWVQADLREAREGDLCRTCGNPVVKIKGIEVGHIFQLGDKYTRSMKAGVLDKDGKSFFPLMGCYGIGVTRTVAASIEQNHDGNGIIWPVSIAPYHVYFCIVGKSPDIWALGEDVFKELQRENIEVLLDDRKTVGAGMMFKDADLLGLPLRLVLGERDYTEKKEFEIRIRKTGQTVWVKRENLAGWIKEWIQKNQH